MIAQVQKIEAKARQGKPPSSDFLANRGSGRIAPVVHLVTLIHDSQPDVSLEVKTPDGDFLTVIREVARQRAERKLAGYRYYEAAQLPAPF